jgi:hypothetical protein
MGPKLLDRDSSAVPLPEADGPTPRSGHRWAAVAPSVRHVRLARSRADPRHAEHVPEETIDAHPSA